MALGAIVDLHRRRAAEQPARAADRLGDRLAAREAARGHRPARTRERRAQSEPHRGHGRRADDRARAGHVRDRAGGGPARVDQRHGRQELRGRPGAHQQGRVLPDPGRRPAGRSPAYPAWRRSPRSTPAPGKVKGVSGTTPVDGHRPETFTKVWKPEIKKGPANVIDTLGPARRGAGRRLGQEQRLRASATRLSIETPTGKTIVLTVRGTVDNKGDVFDRVTTTYATVRRDFRQPDDSSS